MKKLIYLFAVLFFVTLSLISCAQNLDVIDTKSGIMLKNITPAVAQWYLNANPSLNNIVYSSSTDGKLYVYDGTNHLLVIDKTYADLNYATPTYLYEGVTEFETLYGDGFTSYGIRYKSATVENFLGFNEEGAMQISYVGPASSMSKISGTYWAKYTSGSPVSGLENNGSEIRVYGDQMYYNDIDQVELNMQQSTIIYKQYADDNYVKSGIQTAPASATATGTQGTVIITADYIYVCTATNTWKRTAITTW